MTGYDHGGIALITLRMLIPLSSGLETAGVIVQRDISCRARIHLVNVEDHRQLTATVDVDYKDVNFLIVSKTCRP